MVGDDKVEEEEFIEKAIDVFDRIVRNIMNNKKASEISGIESSRAKEIAREIRNSFGTGLSVEKAYKKAMEYKGEERVFALFAVIVERFLREYEVKLFGGILELERGS